MIRQQRKYFYPFLFIIDTFSIILSFLIVSPLLCNLFLDIETKNIKEFVIQFNVLNILPVITVLILTLMRLSGAWNVVRKINPLTEFLRVGFPCITTLIFILVLLNPFTTINPYIYGLTFLFLWVCIYITRLLLFANLGFYRKKRGGINNLLLIGTNKTALDLARIFEKHPEYGISVVGFITFNDEEIGSDILSHKVLGNINDITRIKNTHVVDAILYVGGTGDLKDFRKISFRCEIEGTGFYHTSLIDKADTDFFIDRINGFSFVGSNPISHNPEKLFAKRLFDIFGSFIIILCLIPVWIIIPLLIKLDSKGPVLFKQRRVGKNGRTFSMYKFRSMVADAEKLKEQLHNLNEMDGPVFKIKDDPRITSVGRFIRKASIDELPQLFNVFMGKMSLVGPRPPIHEEVLHYQAWQRKRLSIKPGITCLWQVSGRNELNFEEWIKLDIQYIENWSFMLDIKILLRTIPAVISGRGAK